MAIVPEASRRLGLVHPALETSALTRVAEQMASAARQLSISLDATRMLTLYGARIREQPHFLAEYQINFQLFQHTRLDLQSAFEGADLLARIALPVDLLPSLGQYNASCVERFEISGQSGNKRDKKIIQHRLA